MNGLGTFSYSFNQLTLGNSPCRVYICPQRLSSAGGAVKLGAPPWCVFIEKFRGRKWVVTILFDPPPFSLEKEIYDIREVWST